MNESTARAAFFELQSSPLPSFTWTVNKKPVSVRIPLPIVDRLEQEAVESFRSITSTGSEVGGLLFGSVAQGEPCEVSIEDYELVTCDYSRGPLYRLSEADMARFDRAIMQHGASSSLSVIGIFRSHTRKNLSLDADDLAFFDSRFRDPHHIALLIRPFATKASTAGIFIREGGTVNAEASYLEFPFRSSLLAPDKSGPEMAEAKLPSGLGGALPAPSVPRTITRGQIVPIASRREVTPAIPGLAMTEVEDAVVAEPLPASVEPAASVAAPAAPAVEAKVEQPKVEAPKVEQAKVEQPKVEPPKVEAKLEAPVTVEDKAPAPKPEEKAAKPKVEDKAAPTKSEEKASKPAVADKAVSKTAQKPVTAKNEAKAEKPVVEEKPRRTFEVAAPVVEDAPEATPSKGKSKLMWIGIGAAIPVLLLIALLVYPPLLHRNQPAGPAQDSSQLSLRVERSAGEILLTWNRDSDVIRSAAHAVLAIQDGDQHENVDMDLAQLRNGSISYSPATSDVVFRMEVTGKNQEKTASEQVRALRTRPSPLAGPETAPAPAAQQPAAAAAAAKPNQPGAPNTNPPTANGANTAQPNAPANTAAAAPTAQEETPAKPAAQPLRPFQAPSLSARLHPANASDIPDAPTLGRVETSSSTPTVSGLNMNSVSAPVAPQTPGAPPSAGATKAPTGGQIQQAQLISKKDPEYPKMARDTNAKGIVQLVATIGTDGRVKSVKVVKGPPLLQKAAADAVMQWKYRPTILNGVPVEAQTEVYVNFLGGER